MNRAGRILGVVAAWLVLAVPAVPAVAGDRAGVEFTLLGGARLEPSYLGASSLQVNPMGGFSLGEVRLRGGSGFGRPGTGLLEPGIDLAGAFRYLRPRRAADHPELAGLTDLGRTLELGARVGYVDTSWRAFGTLRYGVVGHNGLVGDFGADLLYRHGSDLVLLLGPRMGWGDGRFMRRHFGVTPAESAASGLAAFAPTGGLVSAGIEAGFVYRLDDRWGLQGSANWSRLGGQAGSSPIVAQGSRDQVTVRLGVTRRFTLRF